MLGACAVLSDLPRVVMVAFSGIDHSNESMGGCVVLCAGERRGYLPIPRILSFPGEIHILDLDLDARFGRVGLS